MRYKKLDGDDIGILFFVAALVFGAWFRIYPVLTTGFPINDGALFYKMIETLQANNFRLPFYVEYNGLNIPFAYPPLAFYVAGLIGNLFHISILNIVLWMPAIVLILILPALFFLSRNILNSSLKAGVTAFLYALLPRALTWLIMGGGVTRALGQLFLILATQNIFLLFTKKQTKYVPIAIIFSAAVCLTHPEASLHAIAIGLALFVFYGRNKEGVRNAALVGAGTVLITSPWWLAVLLRFGFEPFLAASQTGFNTPYSGFSVFFGISEEPLITIIAVFAIIGLFVQIAKSQYLLPVLFALPFFIEPRSAPNITILPIAMLGAICLIDLILPGLEMFETGIRETKPNSILQSASQRLFFTYVIICLLVGMIYFDSTLIQKSLSPESQAAFQWVKDNTVQDSQFLVITGDLALFTDYANEWFPLLSARHSQTTIQGYEWIKAVNFQEQAKTIIGFQDCLSNNMPRICIETLADKSKMSFDYVLIQKEGKHTDNLTLDLSTSKGYRPIFNSNTVVIFERKK